MSIAGQDAPGSAPEMRPGLVAATGRRLLDLEGAVPLFRAVQFARGYDSIGESHLPPSCCSYIIFLQQTNKTDSRIFGETDSPVVLNLFGDLRPSPSPRLPGTRRFGPSCWRCSGLTVDGKTKAFSGARGAKWKNNQIRFGQCVN